MTNELEGSGVYFITEYTDDDEHFCGDKVNWVTGYYDDDITPLKYCRNCGVVDY